jgi:hypothetical protein
MQKFELQFPSLLGLGEFVFLFYMKKYRVSLVKCTIVCQCTEAEIQLAINAFEAKVKPAY